MIRSELHVTVIELHFFFNWMIGVVYALSSLNYFHIKNHIITGLMTYMSYDQNSNNLNNRKKIDYLMLRLKIFELYDSQ